MTRSGIVLDHVDSSVRPQDDLFRHVNGRWLAETAIRPDRPLEGSFTALRDEAEAAVRQIIEESAADPDPRTPAGKVGVVYSRFMDEAEIEARKFTPLAAQLAAIDAVSDRDGLLALLTEFTRQGAAYPLAFFVNNDAGDPTRYLVYLYQAGLGLPDESYYREDEFKDIRARYAEYAEAILGQAGFAPAEAEAAIALEHKLAAGHLDKVSCRDPQKTYNLRTIEELADSFPRVRDWVEGIGGQGRGIAEVVVCQPDFVALLAGLLEDEPVENWKSWLRLQLLSSAAPYLHAEAVQTHFDFYGKVLSGTPELKERWRRGVALVEGALGEAIGQEYVARHFPPSHKERMEELVANLIAAYRESISSLEWLSSETIDRALEKLQAFRTKIGYPTKWIDYSSYVPGDDVWQNVLEANEFEVRRNLDKLGGPIDTEEWHMTPQTVNAYYMPTMNEIVFPAAILQPPFFDADADPAANYGAIGAVIGHEIGHGFDDMGSQYDGTGALRNWWTDADREAFEGLTARLVDQYAVLSPEEAAGKTVNGELTLGENIGDLGGLIIAFKAYQLSLGGQEPPVIDGLSGVQRFFYSWAECWRQKIRSEESVRRLTIDPHSPNEFRCNQVVRNMDEFHAAFDVQTGDGLWLDPAQRVRIW
ncbi:zinc metalloproteinase [Arthrobacter crystallopoietes BAB-32]|uniref:Zinc metalloproteinase n=1 Tax=Arthrobacter crystallopoietes BAB-32 TaxID=1246476 RepID=N1V2J6_9MICC|nr:M13-type metalloendopeptidase [Arthrobacter crystallopoietes]EMY35570.1 zinc metalloproteinase [Arthrobacter crystallopoietes BAB-32]